MSNDQLMMYGAKVCPYAQRVRLVLNEKSIPFEYVDIDLNNKPSWFLDLSPSGKVPLIRHNFETLFESSIICEYLDETFPSNQLLFGTPLMRAKARILTDLFNNTYLPVFYGLLKSQNEEERETLKISLHNHLTFLNQEIGKNAHPYFYGEKIHMVDLMLYPFFERFCVIEHYRQTIIDPQFEHLLKWCDAMQQRSSVQNTKNDNDLYIHHYKKFVQN